MEMCYEGALVMPKNYVVMNEEEMTYVEGGGTIRVYASKNTVKAILHAGVSILTGVIGSAMGVPGMGLVFGEIIANAVFAFILNVCNVQIKSINLKISNPIIPNFPTLNLDNFRL